MTRAELLEAYGQGKRDFADANLQNADLQNADLQYANLQEASLQRASLQNADLQYADLRGADLQCAELQNANLQYANLQEASLQGADLDFSVLPLHCGGLHWHIDARIAAQLAYHLCSMECDDPRFIQARNNLLDFANTFHRVEACGRLLPVAEPVQTQSGKPKAGVGVRAGTAQADRDDGGDDKQQCSIVEALEHINRNFSALNQLVANIALSVSSQYQHRLSGCCGGDGTGIGLNGGNGGGEEEG